MGIQWKERFEIGIKEVDDQHKELFVKTNNLLKACQERRGSDEIESLLNFLGNYVQEHFKSEEKLQRDNNYPGYKEHKEIHDGFVNEIDLFKKEFQDGNESITSLMKLNKTITRWLVNHIKKEDQKLGKYIKERA